MDKLNLMTSFIAVAEQGSFTAAGKQLGKTKALISTHVSQLEKWLQVRLIVRSTRSMQLTAAGQSYYGQARKVLDDLATLESQLINDSSSLVGRLRISAPTTYGELVLMPFIATLGEENRELDIELLLNDRYVDLISEGFDAAIRIGSLEDSSLVARPIGYSNMLLCSAPGFEQRFGPLESIEQLEQLPCVFDTNYRQGASWLLNDGQQLREIKPKAIARVNSALASATLACSGSAVAYCPEFAVTGMLERGELVSLLPALQHPQLPISILYPHRQYLSAKVKAFTEQLTDYCSKPQKKPH